MLGPLAHAGIIHYILLLITKPKKENKRRKKYDISQYKQVDYLKDKISKSPFYSLIHVLDDKMSTDKDEMPDCRARVLAHKRFLHNLDIMVVRGYFSVGIYKYKRTISLSN